MENVAKKKSRCKYSKEDVVKYIKENSGLTFKEIAKNLKMSIGTVHQYSLDRKTERLQKQCEEIRKKIGKDEACIKLKYCYEIEMLTEMSLCDLIELKETDQDGVWKVRFL